MEWWKYTYYIIENWEFPSVRGSEGKDMLPHQGTTNNSCSHVDATY